MYKKKQGMKIKFSIKKKDENRVILKHVSITVFNSEYPKIWFILNFNPCVVKLLTLSGLSSLDLFFLPFLKSLMR